MITKFKSNMLCQNSDSWTRKKSMRQPSNLLGLFGESPRARISCHCTPHLQVVHLKDKSNPWIHFGFHYVNCSIEARSSKVA
jgi:hypothetical protein